MLNDKGKEKRQSSVTLYSKPCCTQNIYRAFILYLYLSLRKEVIQPHLPVRLPCYDFTPLTKHTFDSGLPFGLACRLRVSSTRMV